MGLFSNSPGGPACRWATGKVPAEPWSHRGSCFSSTSETSGQHPLSFGPRPGLAPQSRLCSASHTPAPLSRTHGDTATQVTTHLTTLDSVTHAVTPARKATYSRALSSEMRAAWALRGLFSHLLQTPHIAGAQGADRDNEHRLHAWGRPLQRTHACLGRWVLGSWSLGGKQRLRGATRTHSASQDLLHGVRASHFPRE